MNRGSSLLFEAPPCTRTRVGVTSHPSEHGPGLVEASARCVQGAGIPHHRHRLLSRAWTPCGPVSPFQPVLDQPQRTPAPWAAATRRPGRPGSCPEVCFRGPVFGPPPSGTVEFSAQIARASSQGQLPGPRPVKHSLMRRRAKSRAQRGWGDRAQTCGLSAELEPGGQRMGQAYFGFPFPEAKPGTFS